MSIYRVRTWAIQENKSPKLILEIKFTLIEKLIKI